MSIDGVLTFISFACVAGVIVLHLINRSAVAAQFENNEDLLATWEFEPQVWEKFAELSAASYRSSVFTSLFFLITAALFFIAVSAAVRGDEFGPAYFGVAAVLGLTTYLCAKLSSFVWVRRCKSGPPVVRISRDGAQVARMIYCWSTYGAGIKRLQHLPPFEPGLPQRIHVYYGFSNSSSTSIDLPVPPEREGRLPIVINAIAQAHRLTETTDGWKRTSSTRAGKR